MYVNCSLKSTVDEKHPTAESNRLTYNTLYLSIGLLLRFFFLSMPDTCELFGCSAQRATDNWPWIMMMQGMTEIFSFLSIIMSFYNMYMLDEQISGPFDYRYIGARRPNVS